MGDKTASNGSTATADSDEKSVGEDDDSKSGCSSGKSDELGGNE